MENIYISIMIYMFCMGLKLIQINLSEEMLEGIDRAIELGFSTNRSEFIRSAIGKQLQELSIIQEMKERKPKH